MITDRLAASGVNCTQGYVSAPEYCPSLAGLLTSRDHVEFGYDNYQDDSQPGTDKEPVKKKLGQ